MCLPGNIHLGIRADAQVRPYSVIIESFHTSDRLVGSRHSGCRGCPAGAIECQFRHRRRCRSGTHRQYRHEQCYEMLFHWMVELIRQR